MNTIDPKRRLALAAGALCIGAPALARAERITGSGNIKKQARNVGQFNAIALSISAQVEVRPGATESVTVEADDNVLPLVETVVENGVLKIRFTRRSLNLSNATIRVAVQARRIDSLAVGGSGSIDAHALKAPALRMDIGGSGSIRLRAPETDALDVNVGGSGNLEATGGNARRVAVGIGGSGDVKLDSTRAVHATVNIAGSGNVQLNVREVLKVTIAGSGDVTYYGDPQLSRTVAGSGEVRRLGPLR
jgi:hypothetical protein